MYFKCYILQYSVYCKWAMTENIVFSVLLNNQWFFPNLEHLKCDKYI